MIKRFFFYWRHLVITSSTEKEILKIVPQLRLM